KKSGVIRRWDPATSKEWAPVTIPELKSPGGTYAYSPAGSTLAVTEKDGDAVVRIFDARTGKPRGPDPGHTRPVQALAFSPDGKLLASLDDWQISLWDLATGTRLRTVRRAVRCPNSLLAFSPDGKTFATTTHDCVELWNSSDSQFLRSLS